ncbi:hypothetical protein [Glutamicibacter uratoxydans]|uniref:hypothetical protein n=1 Tax=Glutamicibacter uratoxydans TaxID=43667 RepID=UPI003D6FDFBF
MKEPTIERTKRDAAVGRGYEGHFVFHANDILRLLSLALVGFSWWQWGILEAVVMLLVSGGTWALRFYSLTRWRDFFGQIVLLASGLFSVMGTYQQVSWLDLAVHTTMLWVLTLLLHDALRTHRWITAPETRQTRWGQALMMLSVGSLLAVLWEIGEWFGHDFIDSAVGVGYRDTIGDLGAGLLGAAAAAVLMLRRPHGRRDGL